MIKALLLTTMGRLIIISFHENAPAENYYNRFANYTPIRRSSECLGAYGYPKRINHQRQAGF